MEICCFPTQISAVTNLHSNKTPPFKPLTVSCNMISHNTKAQPFNSGVGDMFILGMGFVGKFFATELKAKGWVVSGSCTSMDKKKNLEEIGYKSYIFDANHPQREVLEVVKNHTHLLVSIPPVAGLGDSILGHKEVVESILKDGRLEWLGYLSSTSVYGDCGGAWVDENYPPKPANDKAVARLAAENEWLSLGHSLGISAHVFRLGGIYGPGRSAVDTVLKQEPLSKHQKARMSKSYTSRVHVSDICQVLHASILKPSSSKIFNIVDDDPAPRVEVIQFAQHLVEEKFRKSGKRIIAPEKSESHTENGGKAEKRVSNALMKKELGVDLIHPSYRSGLRSIIENMDGQSS